MTVDEFPAVQQRRGLPSFPVFCTLLKSDKRIADVVGNHLVLRRGLGPYLSEVLFQAGVHPTRKAATLADSEAMVLYIALDALYDWGSKPSASADSNVSAGEMMAAAYSPMVYGRAGARCFRCGLQINTVTVHGRRIVFCPRDQPTTLEARGLVPQPIEFQPPSQDHFHSFQGIFVLVGPPSAGKTTLAKQLALHLPFISLLPIVKTRRPRPGESHGVDAFYVSPVEFDGLSRGGRIEFAGTYFGNPFGIVLGMIPLLLNSGDDVVVISSPEGGLQIKARYANTFVICLRPPSIAELRRRITERPDYSPSERVERLRRLSTIREDAIDCDFTIVTRSKMQTLYEAAEAIYAVRTGTCRRPTVVESGPRG